MAIETSTASEKSLNKAQVELQAYSRIALLGDMVMLSVHITSKDYSSEMLSPIFSILSACCIPVHLISYAADEPTVYCVISQPDVSQAREALYLNFNQHLAR
ncbi:hypothetical protein BDV29DRAFT_154618 [Aspergillus leporis]|uniref:aspartate kinase n=1 Tax=Aspergillus leporis TaxID=41062 RepID=A0A5N5XAU0_9EURO|nr:hypothetical protein BDV29DRAFT_154618 [Aspergillus leporis]